MTDWSTVGWAAISSVLGAGLISFVFREWLKGSIKHSIEKDLNIQKAQLDRTRDRLQHDLEKEILRSRLAEEKHHSVYPEVYRLLKIAAGGVGESYSLQYSRSWDGYSLADFEMYLIERKVPKGEIEELKKAISSDTGKGILKLNDCLWKMDFSEAYKKTVDAKNFVLLQALYLAPEIYEQSLEICRRLQIAWTFARRGNANFDKGHDEYERASGLLDELREKMRTFLVSDHSRFTESVREQNRSIDA